MGGSVRSPSSAQATLYTYTCLAINTSAPANIDAPIAQLAMELNWDVGGYDFRQCAM
jgi:hypothetical protein